MSKDLGKIDKDCAGVKAPAKRVRRSADETRCAILSTADRLFHARGYDNVSIADVASELQMSPANVFKHFRTKLDLIDEIVQRLVNKMASDVQILDSSHAPIERISHFAHSMMEIHYADFCQNPYIFELLLLTSQRDLKCAAYYRDVVTDLMTQILSDAQSTGIYHITDPRNDAETFLYMFKGVIHPIAFTQNDIEKLRVTCSEIVKFIDRALKNPLA